MWNLIRGANPAPGAWTKFNGKALQIFDSAKLPAKGGARPGTVTEITAEGFVVACNGGQIAVKRVKPADGPKQKAADFVASSGLKAGTTVTVSQRAP